MLSLIKRQGALTIRDIEDDVLVEKDHAWASRKPSAKALRLAFYRGRSPSANASAFSKPMN